MKDKYESWFIGLVVIALMVAIFNPILGSAIFGVPILIALCISAASNRDK